MALFYDGGVFIVAGGLLILGAATLWQAIVCLRWSERRAAALWSAAALPLFGLALALTWFGLRHPDLDLWNSRGLGPGWACANLGRPAADVCFRDAQPAVRSDAKDAKVGAP